MPVIRISDATWKRMKRHATPLEDSADDVVRKALDALDEGGGRKRQTTPTAPPPVVQPVVEEPAVERPRAARPPAVQPPAAPQPAQSPSPPADEGSDDSARLPQKSFRLPLIETLCILGGAGSTKEIREILSRKLGPQLGPADHAAVSSGDPRWWNAVCWERNALVAEGLVKKDSPRGNWELTAEAMQSLGGVHEFIFTRDYATSVDSQIVQFMKGQTVPAHHFGHAVREKWPIEAAQPQV